MLISLLYHRVGFGKGSNSQEMMQKHLERIAHRFLVILPGEKIPFFRRAICLTFDDATYDFYHYVFPLLQHFNLRALLAVPVSYIQEKTSLDPQLRLSVSASQMMKENTYQTHVPFCTWEELTIMTNSGHVEIASHSLRHKNLLIPPINLEQEIIQSKKILEDRLSISVKTFVYPLGKFNQEIHSLVQKHYAFAMRIGSACNFSWQNQNGLIYRILSDNLSSFDQPTKFSSLCSSLWFYLLNSLRGR